MKNQPDLWPVRPQDVVGTQVCWDSGDVMSKKEDGSESCQARFEYFIKGTEPKESHISKMPVPVGPDDKMVPADFPGAEMKEKTVIRDPLNTYYCVDCNHEGGDPIQNVRL